LFLTSLRWLFINSHEGICSSTYSYIKFFLTEGGAEKSEKSMVLLGQVKQEKDYSKKKEGVNE